MRISRQNVALALFTVAGAAAIALIQPAFGNEPAGFWNAAFWALVLLSAALLTWAIREGTHDRGHSSDKPPLYEIDKADSVDLSDHSYGDRPFYRGREVGKIKTKNINSETRRKPENDK